MGIASEMKELTRIIASSHEDRMRRVGEIREETQSLIMGFEASRKELKAELKESSVAWQELASAKAKNK